MRSCLALTCAIFITGYATSSSIPPTIRSREVGESLDLSVFTSDAEIEQCYLQKPNGDTISLKPNDESDEKYEILENMPMVSMCRVRILNLTPNDNGIWTLNAVDLAGQTLHQPYNLTVNVVPEYLPEKVITTTIGREHEISISEPESDVTQSCEITTPNGEKHSLEEASLDSVVKYSSAGSTCGVKITVASEDFVGSWALTARGLTFEKIQPFVVSVKDTDAAAITPPTTSNLDEGDSLMISVITNDDEVQKCHLTTPNNVDIQFKPVDESDERFELLEDIESESRCRVKILNLTPADNGQWFLRAVSNGESRYVLFNVTVNPAPDTSSTVTYPPSSTTSIPTTINRIEGESFETAVTTFSSKTNKCYLQNPTGTEVQFKPKDESGDKYELLEDIEHVSDCRVRILNLTLHDIGLWTLKAEDSEGTILFQEYDVHVSPDVREEIEVEYLPAQEITTSLGSVHSFSIQELGAYTSETCMIVNPLGKQINLKEDKMEGLELLTSSDFNCGVNITVLSEEFVGNWTLIANGKRFVTKVQRRLPIEISVEMIVPASPNRVVVGYSNNFHVALANPISEPQTCKLLDPYGNEHIDNYDMQSDRCAFIVKYVFSWHNGTWTIVYGTRIVYKAFIEVFVVEPNDDLQNLKLRWDLHSRVQQVIGPEDAIYCKVIDPLLRTVFDGFGRCQINIERVSPDHFGHWKMYVSRQGHVLPEEQLFSVVASAGTADPRPNVLTHVDVEKPNIYMACTLPGSVNVTTCTFRDPKGRMLLAHSGVTQGRYGYHGTRVSYETRALNHTCGLLITDPINEDVGFWRCAIQTKDDIHYGHINVPTPWFMRDPEDVAQIEKKPRLTAEHTTVQAIVGETVTMSCSIPASFHYCYFRARNGTIYHVAPYLDRYVGAGFEAGECGIRFPSLAVSDSGPWSCHVGFDLKDPDQSVTFDVKVEEPLTVTQGDRGRAMRVRAVLNVFTDIRYCVFVRIDGQSFSTQKWSGGYSGWVSDNLFSCELNINDPTPLDRNAWTVIAHLTGGASVQGSSRPRTIVYSFRFPTTWLIVMVAGLSLAMLGAILSPNKNRRWVAARASDASNSFRNSFRRTFRNDVKNNTTAVAA
ncbi:uncharacterized protein LOC123700753 [Colias croceus]|uniref:uncharacterized protein LOC123700753 n=1 Tax=Colias crocea TaxID=72248 RepID=UPI001E27F376|nr:uncharacterized protein LOC123700753 [Colias croceus]